MCYYWKWTQGKNQIAARFGFCLVFANMNEQQASSPYFLGKIGAARVGTPVGGGVGGPPHVSVPAHGGIAAEAMSASHEVGLFGLLPLLFAVGLPESGVVE